ncbi:MAG: transposase [Planctomycetaceae bacterium]
MRAEIARFERFDNGKQLARYCGVTPPAANAWPMPDSSRPATTACE